MVFFHRGESVWFFFFFTESVEKKNTKTIRSENIGFITCGLVPWINIKRTHYGLGAIIVDINASEGFRLNWRFKRVKYVRNRYSYIKDVIPVLTAPLPVNTTGSVNAAVIVWYSR